MSMHARNQFSQHPTKGVITVNKQATQPIQIRQGDVYLLPIEQCHWLREKKLPKGCVPIEPENGTRFVLAHGEVTGHAHAVYEYTADREAEQEAARLRAEGAAKEVMEAALERARTRRTAQMWASPDGEWYLEIRQPSTMRHEEHSAPTIPPGVYHAPVQVESGPDNMTRIVAD